MKTVQIGITDLPVTTVYTTQTIVRKFTNVLAMEGMILWRIFFEKKASKVQSIFHDFSSYQYQHFAFHPLQYLFF